MKLLVCHACADVIAIRSTNCRPCSCGASSAALIDSLHVRYHGPATILGLFNSDVSEAITMSDRFRTTWPLRAHAFPPGDGVLRSDDRYCTRCRGTSQADGWEAHTLSREEVPTDFVNLAAPDQHGSGPAPDTPDRGADRPSAPQNPLGQAAL